jgi:hypothetical protein
LLSYEPNVLFFTDKIKVLALARDRFGRLQGIKIHKSEFLYGFIRKRGKLLVP